MLLITGLHDGDFDLDRAETERMSFLLYLVTRVVRSSFIVWFGPVLLSHWPVDNHYLLPNRPQEFGSTFGTMAACLKTPTKGPKIAIRGTRGGCNRQISNSKHGCPNKTFLC